MTARAAREGPVDDAVPLLPLRRDRARIAEPLDQLARLALPDAPEPDRPEAAAGGDGPASGRPGAVRLLLCPDGPVVVRGPVELVDEAGAPVRARRRTVALCRCGGSAIKPWCDGTHKVNGYRSDA